jgi:hypothetical protein
MEILWLAIVFYSVGLAGILYFRPSLMFNEDGTWKEFGYQRNARHTIFPFWLFAITWAFVSYALASATRWMSVETAAVATAAVSTYYSGEEDYDEDDEETDMIPVSEVLRRRPGRPKGSKTKKSESSSVPPRSGYYVLDPASRESGLSRYIYYGEKAPADADVLESETD